MLGGRGKPAREVAAVAALTAKSADLDIFKAMQLGVDYYITKPFDIQQLVAMVNRVFETEVGGEWEGGTI